MTNDVYLIDPWHDLAREMPVSVPGVLQSMTAICGEIPDDLATEQHLYAFANSCNFHLADEDVESALIWPNRRFVSRAWLKEEYSKFLLFAMENNWLDGTIEAKKAWPFETQKGTLPLAEPQSAPPTELGHDLFPIPGVPTFEETKAESEIDDGIPRRKPRGRPRKVEEVPA